MERYGSIESVLRAEIVELGAALDAEREKVKRLSTCGTDHSTPWWQVKCEDLEAQLATLQAQLRQVEGENELLKSGQRYMALEKERDTLRQLVSALPVVDVQEVSVWLSPDESGWLVSKRPAFPAGLYWAKFRTQAEADSFRALLAYRATLVVQDAPQPAPNERVEYARLELAALFSTPGTPTLEQAKLVCENKNPADAQCILNAYEALREAAQDAGKGYAR